MKKEARKQDAKDNARSVPFFARYLAGQEKDGDESTGDGRRRTLKFPSDGDEGDWRR